MRSTRLHRLAASTALLFLFFVVPAALAQESFQPSLSVNIPTVNFSQIQVQESNTSQGISGYIDVPWIAEYVMGVYRYGIAISGIVASVIIVIGGFQYMTGKPAEGKEKIQRTLIGVVLVLGSYVMLRTISPDLTSFKALRIATVAKNEFTLPENFPEDTSPGEITQAPPAAAVQANTTGTTRVKGPGIKGGITFNTANASSLLAAGAALNEATKNAAWGPGLIRGGGERSLEDQMEFYKNRCIAGILPSTVKLEGREKCTVPTCSPFPASEFVMNPPGHKGKWLKENAQPDVTRCPHNSSVAVDISCSTSKNAIKGIHIPCHLELEKAMKAQGFCRLTTEPWHFEKPKLSSNCVYDWTPGTYIEKSGATGPKGVTRNYGNCTGYYSAYEDKVPDDNARCSPTPPK